MKFLNEYKVDIILTLLVVLVTCICMIPSLTVIAPPCDCECTESYIIYEPI